MSSTTMALGSQPASMPAESNLDQMTHLISPARSELSEIDPSWEILALAAEPGSTLACNGASRDAPLCASPHTPVCAPPPALSPPSLADAAKARRLASERARKKKTREKKAEARRLVAIAAAAGDAGREMREAPLCHQRQHPWIRYVAQNTCEFC